MSYEIQEGYPKLHNVAKEDSALAEQYKSKFNEVNADIAGAQALIDDDPTSENYNGDLVLNADKLNAICDSLDDLQPTFINAKETLAEWMMNFSKEITEYDSTETYNYGEVVTYQDTSETIQSNAHAVTVPSGAKLATVQKYGGKSLVFNQLVQNGNFVDTSGWLTTASHNISVSNNICTFTPKVGSTYAQLEYRDFIPRAAGHKICMLCEVKRDSVSMQCRLPSYDIDSTLINNHSSNVTSGNMWVDGSKIVTLESNCVKIRLIFSATTSDEPFQVKNVMVIDLTQMFGAGNEPTTVEEVKALLPNDYYEYNTGEIIHADVDKVVYTDTDEVSTDYPIPQAIKSLEGYGWSAGNVYNEVDFERKKFIKRVGRVDLGEQILALSPIGYFNAYIDVKVATSGTAIPNLLCKKYVVGTPNALYGGTVDKAISTATGSKTIWVRDSDYADATAFRTAMNGVYLYYELATPVEIDISDILEPFNVEEGGTITFHNSNGDGYRISVPSKIKFGHGINGTFICIDKNVTGAFNPSKWLMLTPSDLGFDLTDAEVIDNNGLVEIYLNDEMIAQVIPNLIYLDDENDAQNGMVYLVRVDGNKYQLRYKDNNGDVNVLNNETNANISTYENNSIQTELNRLKEFMERSD